MEHLHRVSNIRHSDVTLNSSFFIKIIYIFQIETSLSNNVIYFFENYNFKEIDEI